MPPSPRRACAHLCPSVSAWTTPAGAPGAATPCRTSAGSTASMRPVRAREHVDTVTGQASGRHAHDPPGNGAADRLENVPFHRIRDVERLQALVGAMLVVEQDLDLATVLRTVVETAVDLVGA